MSGELANGRRFGQDIADSGDPALLTDDLFPESVGFRRVVESGQGEGHAALGGRLNRTWRRTGFIGMTVGAAAMAAFASAIDF